MEDAVHIENLPGPWQWAVQVRYARVHYARVVRVGDLVTATGIGPYSGTGEVENGSFELQARRTFNNLDAVLRTFGADLSNVLSMTSFLINADDHHRFAAVRPEFLAAPFPAMTAVNVRELDRGVAVELSAVAMTGVQRGAREADHWPEA